MAAGLKQPMIEPERRLMKVSLGCGDLLHCKHLAGGFGTVRVDRVLKDRIEVLETANGRSMTFRSVEELIQAGWTTD
jgi:hypothetical protein